MSTIAGVFEVDTKSRTYLDYLDAADDFSQLYNRVCDDQVLSPCAKLTFWVLVANSQKTTLLEDDSPAFGTYKSVAHMAAQTGMCREYIDAGIRELWAYRLITCTMQTGKVSHVVLPSLDRWYPRQASTKRTPRTYNEYIKGGNYSCLANAVLRDTELSKGAKLVFWSLVRRSNGISVKYENGDPALGCWVGVSRMAVDLGISEREVRRAVALLVERGIVARKTRGRMQTARTILLPLESVYQPAQ